MRQRVTENGFCTAFGVPLHGPKALVYRYPVLYPLLCNPPTDGLHGDVKSTT